MTAEVQGDHTSINTSTAEIVSHFWVTTYPFFQTELLLASPLGDGDNEEDKFETILRLFDPDGELVDKTTLSLSTGVVHSISLEQMMLKCKLESGFRHGHLVVVIERTRKPVIPYLSIFGNESHLVIPAGLNLSSESAHFPITLSGQFVPLIGIVNCSPHTASLKIRLSVHTDEVKQAEVLKTITGNGSRLISIFDEFSHCSFPGVSTAYIRVAPRGGETSFQLTAIEQVRNQSQEITWQALI